MVRQLIKWMWDESIKNLRTKFTFQSPTFLKNGSYLFPNTFFLEILLESKRCFFSFLANNDEIISLSNLFQHLINWQSLISSQVISSFTNRKYSPHKIIKQMWVHTTRVPSEKIATCCDQQ